MWIEYDQVLPRDEARHVGEVIHGVEPQPESPGRRKLLQLASLPPRTRGIKRRATRRQGARSSCFHGHTCNVQYTGPCPPYQHQGEIIHDSSKAARRHSILPLLITFTEQHLVWLSRQRQDETMRPTTDNSGSPV